MDFNQITKGCILSINIPICFAKDVFRKIALYKCVFCIDFGWNHEGRSTSLCCLLYTPEWVSNIWVLHHICVSYLIKTKVFKALKFWNINIVACQRDAFLECKYFGDTVDVWPGRVIQNL